MRIFTWLLRGVLFVLLVVLALQNTHEAVLHLFFGSEFRAPMMIIVLAAFAAGALLGVLAALSWRVGRRAPPAPPPAAAPRPAAREDA
ncbi:MAG: DUF1049 domain-containing protein [Betaproteobacteria bacterium]|nr:DUF1049 domain-containing protein [Betaproteobacteria bacterium]